MKETLKLINKYIPEFCTIKINGDNKNKELIYYNLYNEKENDIGYLYLTNSGEIKSYLYKNNDYKQAKYDSNDQEIKEKANQFINEFYTERSLTLLSLTKTSQNYEVIYEEKEMKYDLYLPGTGIEISFDLLGIIERVEQKISMYEIAYPNTIITPEEAKIKFLDGLNLDLKISKPLNHLHYELYYRINEKLKNVPASGNNGEIIKNKQILESLDEFETSSKNLLRILGLNENYKKIAKKSKLNFKIEIWSKYSKKELKQLNFAINDSQIGVIKYKIDKHTNKIVQICDGEVLEEDYVEKISESQAYDKALDFLFTLYPNAEELFDVLKLEKDEETKNEIKNEPNYTYFFNRIHDSIEIENQIANVGVGQYTGMINQFCAPNVTEKELAHIYVFAKVSESEAKNIYAEQLEMNLKFIKNVEENGPVNYELVYLPSYPNKKAEINLIDAHSGTIIDREVRF